MLVPRGYVWEDCNNGACLLFLFRRSAILSDVSSSASRKLPSNKSIVLLGTILVG